jgi:hypothetical protein
MCVVSMIMDHYNDKWKKYIYPPLGPQQIPSAKELAEQIEELRKFIERAKEYDKRNNEPDCEMEEKRRLLKELAEKLGVEINFI